MADLEGRLSPSCMEDVEEEALDPRIQDELERLNKASEEINRLELALDDARASFRQALTDSTYKLDTLAKKLGSCVDKARPYYDSRLKSKELHVETQKAAYMFERACSMHEAAKEMVQLAEQGYMQREDSSDQAWQEMLNHATMKVNDAEKERLESEKVHMRTTMKFKEAEEHVQKLQKELKRTINKSKPYFEMKAKFNQMMEDRKNNVNKLEVSVTETKKTYSDALRNLEEISEAIHQKRLEMRNQAELGIRGAGVGSESPSPPPMRGKLHVSIDGKTSHLASSCNTGNSLTTVTSAHFSVSNTTGQNFTPPSVIYSSPEKARSESYRKAIDARLSVSNDLENIPDNYRVNVDDEYLSLPKSPRAGYSDESDVFSKSDDRFSVQSEDSTQLSTSSSSKGKKSAKLKGLILIPVGAGQDPLQANLRITTKPHLATRSRTEPIRPASYPYSHNTDNQREVISPVTSSSIKTELEDRITDIKSPGSDTSGRRMLRVPSSQDFDEGSISDTESITSGTMLDDDQVEFLTMDFSACNFNSVNEHSESQEYRRFSLPPSFSEIENLVRRQISHEKDIEEHDSDKNDETITSDDVLDSVESRTPSEKIND
ncbi:SH3 domain-binding protein 5-like [Mactra antiquata]